MDIDSFFCRWIPKTRSKNDDLNDVPQKDLRVIENEDLSRVFFQIERVLNAKN